MNGVRVRVCALCMYAIKKEKLVTIPSEKQLKTLRIRSYGMQFLLFLQMKMLLCTVESFKTEGFGKYDKVG